MKPMIFTFWTLIAVCLFAFPQTSQAMTPADREQYEKLGLSETEWAMILDAKLPLSKVQELLRAGISITQYFKQPWIDLDLSEDEWLEKRRAGLTDKDMRTIGKRQASRVPNEGAGMVAGFFLPGTQQLSRGQTGKGWTMAGLALGSIAFCAGHSAITKSFQPLGLILLVPDMVWSGVDIGMQINKEVNPGASRFSGLINNDNYSISLTFFIP
jgi:TM2 domain-containing membrane protein YozV